MITVEKIIVKERQLQKTKSDTYMIRQIETNKIYSEAIDIIPCIYSYEETNIPLENIEEEELT